MSKLLSVKKFHHPCTLQDDGLSSFSYSSLVACQHLAEMFSLLRHLNCPEIFQGSSYNTMEFFMQNRIETLVSSLQIIDNYSAQKFWTLSLTFHIVHLLISFPFFNLVLLLMGRFVMEHT